LLTEASGTEASGTEGQIASVAAANGLGGIGKTALATEVVRRLMATTAFPDGIGVVICKGLIDPVEILRSVLARFSSDRRPPDDVAIPALADRARQLFRGKHALVVLDNVEQGWPVREVIQPLRAAGAAVLLTSRAELAAVPREASVKLEVLPLDEALDVFAEYYGRGAALDLTRPELAAATTIVESLGRHTLAVKLSAANAATLGRPLEVVARELELNPRRALLLADSDEAVRFVLESSYDALSQRAQRLFVTLGAFATSDIGRIALLEVTRVLREEVVDDEDDQQAAAEVEAALREVVALRLADTAVDERIPPDADRERLRLHPLVRTYAEELLGRQDEAQRDEAQRVIAAFYADYANAVADLALGPDEANVIGAIEWAHAHDDDLVLARLCRGIADFWRDTGRVQAGMMYLPWGAAAAERVAERTDERADRLRAITISGFYADLLRGMGRLSEAEALYLRDLDARRALGDRDGEATALSDLGEIALMKGHSVEAEQYGLQALEIVRDLHSRREEEAVLTILGRVALRQGHVEDAEDYFQQALAIDREVHNRHDEAVDLAYLGQVALQRGSLEDAADRFSKALEIMREVDDRRSAGGVLFTLGAIAERRERIEEAEHYYHLSLEIRRQVQDLQGELVTLNSLAGLAQRQGRPEEAQRLYEQSLDVARDVGDRAGEGVTLFQLAQIAEERGDLDRAEKLHRQSLAIGREIENVRDIADSLRELGRFLIVRRENLEEGRQMLAEAADLYAQLGATDREQEIRKILSELESR
ncbi:MAG TPA: tetratricopeptide repeat protein, partial [Ktedonobacterales bacterium]